MAGNGSDRRKSVFFYEGLANPYGLSFEIRIFWYKRYLHDILRRNATTTAFSDLHITGKKLWRTSGIG